MRIGLIDVDGSVDIHKQRRNKVYPNGIVLQDQEKTIILYARNRDGQ